MEYVTIETITAEGENVRFELAAENAYWININGLLNESPYKIVQISVCDNYTVVMTSCISDSHENVAYHLNNISAYNNNGQHLWDISEIIEDMETPIQNMRLITKEKAEREHTLPDVPENNILLECNDGRSISYIIDIAIPKLLHKDAVGEKLR